MAHMHTADVTIVGAGPVGLALAGELAAAGVSCTILERRGDQSNLTRAFAVHARTLELLDARGLAGELIGRGATVPALRLFGRVELDLTRLPSRFAYLLAVPQYETERVLERRALALGARIERGRELTGLRQDAGGVDLDVRGEDGTTATRRASYVVGCDGVHSTVRQALDLPFPGHAVLRSVMLADVRLSDAPDLLSVQSGRDGLVFIAPFGDGWYRIIAWDRRHQVPDDAPVDLEEIRDITRRTHGTDYEMRDVRWVSRFHSDERQVPSYRAGRVFLAGDAAHVHSPAGGMGMNVGIQDAMNLGWKLAATLQGRSPQDLLDTYHAERHPAGREALRTSSRLLRLATLRSGVPRIAAGTLVTGFRPIADRAAGAVSSISLRYRARPGAHRLAGRRAPDVELASGGRLYEALRSGRFVLVTSAAAPTDPAGGWSGTAAVERSAAERPAAMLVRPDGYVAWASDEAGPQRRRDAALAALREWCGAPDARQTAARA